jgi:hypothetical protein
LGVDVEGHDTDAPQPWFEPLLFHLVQLGGFSRGGSFQGSSWNLGSYYIWMPSSAPNQVSDLIDCRSSNSIRVMDTAAAITPRAITPQANGFGRAILRSPSIDSYVKVIG